MTATNNRACQQAQGRWRVWEKKVPSADQECTICKYIGSQWQGWVRFGRGKREQGNLDHRVFIWRIRVWKDESGMAYDWRKSVLAWAQRLRGSKGLRKRVVENSGLQLFCMYWEGFKFVFLRWKEWRASGGKKLPRDVGPRLQISVKISYLNATTPLL